MDTTPDRRKAYFFGNDDFIDYYDDVDCLVQPFLATIHDMMIDLVIETIKARRGQSTERRPSILVVGSGTGAEVLRIARRLSGACMVAVDFCAGMNSRLRVNYSAEHSQDAFEAAVCLVEEDFLSPKFTPDILKATLFEKFRITEFDAAVMGFVTHHYSVEEKFEFYRRVSAVLAKGGGLVHGDLFDYASKWLSRYAHEFGGRWIAKQLTDPDTEFYPHFSKVRHMAPRLREAWVEHWNHTHIYTPIYVWSKAADGVEYTYKSHVDMLQKLKFAEIECPLRLWEAGIIWARK